jgi:alanine racemase
MTPPAPLRLNIDLGALTANWRWFRQTSGVDTGAAVKADGYGLGAHAVVDRLLHAGCRTFYVATWAEAATLAVSSAACRIKVLHGIAPDEMPVALAIGASPVLNSPEQLVLWRDHGGGRTCDVMIDTGMNRLGIDWRTFSGDMLAGLMVDTVHSHLACADDPESPMNAEQLRRFDTATRGLGLRRSIAGSGGACLGTDYALDHIRPGLGLYGGVPSPAAMGRLERVVMPEARILQVRDIRVGDSAGYGATWRAARDSRLAVINLGYADGYLTGFSNRGACVINGARCAVVGRVSMDLTIVDVTDAPPVAAGDWIGIDYDLPTAASASGLSQYELLTGLGARYQRTYL